MKWCWAKVGINLMARRTRPLLFSIEEVCNHSKFAVDASRILASSSYSMLEGSALSLLPASRSVVAPSPRTVRRREGSAVDLSRRLYRASRRPPLAPRCTRLLLVLFPKQAGTGVLTLCCQGPHRDISSARRMVSLLIDGMRYGAGKQEKPDWA